MNKYLIAGGLLLALMLLQTFVYAEETEEYVFEGDNLAERVASLKTGEQLVVHDRSVTLPFARQTLELDAFSGVLGYASDLAYVVTIAGQVKMGEHTASAGRMVLIPPAGTPPTVQRFDARRLARSWRETISETTPVLYNELKSLARRQSLGVFFGRYTPTYFNAAVSGEVSQELARRSVVGEAAVREIRFASFNNIDSRNRRIVRVFIDALVQGDVETVAAFLDPVPFGNTDLRDGGAEARKLLATSLLDRHDWEEQFSGDVSLVRIDQNRWQINGESARYIVHLRPMGDFAYIRSIERRN